MGSLAAVIGGQSRPAQRRCSRQQTGTRGGSGGLGGARASTLLATPEPSQVAALTRVCRRRANTPTRSLEDDASEPDPVVKRHMTAWPLRGCGRISALSRFTDVAFGTNGGKTLPQRDCHSRRRDSHSIGGAWRRPCSVPGHTRVFLWKWLFTGRVGHVSAPHSSPLPPCPLCPPPPRLSFSPRFGVVRLRRSRGGCLDPDSRGDSPWWPRRAGALFRGCGPGPVSSQLC